MGKFSTQQIRNFAGETRTAASRKTGPVGKFMQQVATVLDDAADQIEGLERQVDRDPLAGETYPEINEEQIEGLTPEAVKAAKQAAKDALKNVKE